jgi:hypothetical protein
MLAKKAWYPDLTVGAGALIQTNNRRTPAGGLPAGRLSSKLMPLQAITGSSPARAHHPHPAGTAFAVFAFSIMAAKRVK